MYIYKCKFEPHSEELIKYEMSCIFNQAIDHDVVVSEVLVNPNRSYAINYRIDVLYSGKSVDDILPQITDAKLYYEGFKIEFIDVKSDVMEYRTRIGYCIQIADLIDGYGQMKDPTITFVVTKVDDVWYFGKLTRNDRSFERLQSKIHTYSHSMSCSLSRAVVNIACGQEQPKLIDPCSGIGTVLAEASEMGYDISGTELNELVYYKAKENLEALGIEVNFKCQDMHQITEKYDVSILDIPYGLMSKTSTELQTGLISKCYEISNKLVLVANEDSLPLIEKTKWTVKDKIDVPKANYMFTRYIYILTK